MPPYPDGARVQPNVPVVNTRSRRRGPALAGCHRSTSRLTQCWQAVCALQVKTAGRGERGFSMRARARARAGAPAAAGSSCAAAAAAAVTGTRVGHGGFLVMETTVFLEA